MKLWTQSINTGTPEIIALFYFKVISLDFNKFYIFLKLAQNSYKTRAEELY